MLAEMTRRQDPGVGGLEKVLGCKSEYGCRSDTRFVCFDGAMFCFGKVGKAPGCPDARIQMQAVWKKFRDANQATGLGMTLKISL